MSLVRRSIEIAILGVIAALALFSLPRSSQADEPTDFGEYLSRMDLVVEGTVTAVDTVFRTRLGGCGVTGLGPTKSWDIHIRVSRVVLGTAEDSSVVLTTLGRSQFPGPGLRPGVRVIGWAHRNCSDGWRLWGNVVLVSSSGLLIPDHHNAGSIRLQGQPRTRPIRFTALDSSLAEKVEMSSVRAFEGAASVALLRVTALTPGAGSTYSLACDSLGVLMGLAGRVPRYVDMDPLEGCTRAVGVGDSIVVALPTGFSAERLNWRGCSSSLLVKERFVAGFGVPLDFLNYAIRRDGDQLQVRPFIAREE